MAFIDLAHAVLVVLVLVTMLVGLVGSVLPVLPGLALIWGAALVYGLAWGFGAWGPWLFALITLLAIAGYGANFFLTHVGAANAGASWQALLASFALAIVGFFVIPVVGALVGAVAGVCLVEYLRRKDARQAWRATAGALVGFGLGFVVQVSVGVLMILAWGVWVWLG